MAKFEIMIPFILHFAAGVSPQLSELPYKEQFEMARKRGWSNDPDDPGGATMIDVTLTTYRGYLKRNAGKEELRNISFEEWGDILKRLYWDVWRGDEIVSQGIANILVDWIWASGPKTIRNAQKILGVKADGKPGPVTIGAINNSDTHALFAKIKSARTGYYKNCSGAWKYLKGWLRRLNAINPDGSFSY